MGELLFEQESKLIFDAHEQRKEADICLNKYTTICMHQYPSTFKICVYY